LLMISLTLESQSDTVSPFKLYFLNTVPYI
jgi:hypothetical protein